MNRQEHLHEIQAIYPDLPPFRMTMEGITREKWNVVLFGSDASLRQLHQQALLLDMPEDKPDSRIILPDGRLNADGSL